MAQNVNLMSAVVLILFNSRFLHILISFQFRLVNLVSIVYIASRVDIELKGIKNSNKVFRCFHFNSYSNPLVFNLSRIVM